jgi:multidrug efflux system outer membrane protein
VRAQSEHYTQLVNVYKAMGGGWVDEADSVAPQPQAARKMQPAAPGRDGK